MALTDKQLEIISEALLPLFQYLETQVIIDVTNRIKNTLAYTRSAELLAESMQKLGYSPAKIRYEAMKQLKADAAFEKVVAQNTLEHKKKVKELLTEILGIAQEEKDGILKDAVDLSFLDDLGIWQQGGMELTDNSFLPQLVAAIQKQTAGELKNLTGTTGFKTVSGFEPMESLYRKELDKAMIKVCTGTYTREQVLYDVVHNLADSGLRTIDFASGYSMQLDTAVRVAMRTGAHQIAGKVTDKNIEKTGVNLVRVSTHWGARNEGTGHANHAEWQGKVYFIKNGEDYGEEADRIGQDSISDLWQATGYSIDGAHENDPLGLYGYNCRHRHYPWFEGISEFPKEDPEPKPVTINGKTYDYYAITQKQRSMERSIRALKREKEAIKALDMDTKEIKAKIKRRIGQYEAFSDAAKVEPKYNRLRYECGTSDLKKTKAWKNMDSVKRYENAKVSHTVTNHNAQEYRPIEKSNIASTQFRGEKEISIRKIINTTYSGDLYVSDAVHLKPKEMHTIEKSINDSLKLVGGNANLPKCMIISPAEMQTGAICSYNAVNNIMYINSVVADVEKLLYLQKDMVCPNNPLSTYVHEFIHWKDAQNYIKNAVIANQKDYLMILRKKSKKKLDELQKKGYNIFDISKYASDRYAFGFFDETLTEYKVFKILGKE